MPPPRARLDPRDYFGYTGNPLPLAEESVPLPQAMRERFDRAGQSAFLPYVKPWETLAQTQGFEQQANNLAIADVENRFINEVGTGRSGFADFLAKNPLMSVSPMAATYLRIHGRPASALKDPYEETVAKEGSEYLAAYKAAVAGGQAPLEAFAEFRDVVTKEKGDKKTVEDEELWFVEQGGDLDEYASLKDKTRAEKLDYLNKNRRPTATEAKRLADLEEAVEAEKRNMAREYAEDMEKYKKDAETALGRAPGETSKEDWDAAYEAIYKSRVGPKEEALEEYIKERGLKIKGKTAPVIPTAPIPSVQNVPQGTPAPVAPPPAIVPPPIEPAPFTSPGTPRKPGASPLSQVREALKP